MNEVAFLKSFQQSLSNKQFYESRDPEVRETKVSSEREEETKLSSLMC